MILIAEKHLMWVTKQMDHTDWSLTEKQYARWFRRIRMPANKQSSEKGTPKYATTRY